MRERVASAVRSRVIDPVLLSLRQGATPKSIAVSMSAGTVIGVFPVLGLSTVLCLVLVVALRLNLVAIQAANWLVYPLQIVLILPFIQLGQRLFGRTPVTLSPEQLQVAFELSWLQAIAGFWNLMLSGVLAWGVTAVPAGVILYHVIVLALRWANVGVLAGRDKS
ncbi:MAG: DUF2062 domain-containing protein [Gammaproteobacteria bacterium]|nr:DUF2062 domain-containing protein [Gammaproteobacteria bacterium]